MPKNITDSDVFTTQVTAIQDGDLLNSANLADIGVQHLANRTLYLKNRVPGIAASYRMVVPLVARNNLSARFDGSVYNTYLQTNITDGGQLDFSIPVPPVGKIQEIHALVTGSTEGGSGHAALPANKPVLQLRSKNITSGGSHAATTTIANVTDSSGTAAAYNLIHLISATGLAHTIDTNKSYSAIFVGEFGASSEANKLHLMEIYLVLVP